MMTEQVSEFRPDQGWSCVSNLFEPFRKVVQLIFSLTLVFSLSACGITTRVTAQERTFLPLSLEFLDQYELPKSTFQDTPVGGLSALTYDRQKDRFYVLSDDRSQFAPARFYTLNLALDQSEADAVKIGEVEVEAVTLLTNEQGENYLSGSVDPEGIALSPKRTLYLSSEGVPKQGISPFIAEFSLDSGQLQHSLRLPQRYLPAQTEAEPTGVQENLGFEALTLSPTGLAVDDPFRLFAATESALLQDTTPDPEAEGRIRFLHYVIGSVGEPIVVAEHLYLLDPAPDALANGLTELVTLEREGYFLSLERTYGVAGAGAKVFQMVVGNATDTSRINSLKGNLGQVVPLKKKLLLDLGELGIELDNLEGMALGPHLKDRSQSLVLLSDDNFKDNQVTQLLLFRLVKN